MPLGDSALMYLSNCDVATPGSPINRMCMSPLRDVPSSMTLWEPPNNWSATASFSSSIPKMVGAMDATIFFRISGSFAISRICSSSSLVMLSSEKSFCSNSHDRTSMKISDTVLLSRSVFCTVRMIPLRVTLFPGVILPAMSSSM